MALVLLAVAVLCLALALHGAAMGDHMMAMLGACLAVLVVIALVLEPVSLLGLVVAPIQAPRSISRVTAPVPLGRHPPDEGTILLR